MVGTNIEIGSHWVSLGVIGGYSIENFREFSTDHFSPLLCSECSVAYNAIVLLLMDFQCIEAMKLEFAAVTTL